jgi:hypothetical protein
MFYRILLFVCGVMTVLIGRVYGGLRQFAPPQQVWSPFFYVFLIAGIIAVCLSFAPTAWTERTTGDPGELRRSVPFRFLLSFAAVGLLLVIAFTFVSGRFASPSHGVLYSLCPACALTVTVDPSLGVSLFVLAPLNALVFGAVGGVIGTAFSMLSR